MSWEKEVEKLHSQFRTAERFGVEEIIDPRDTPMRKPEPRSFGYRP